MQVTGEVGNEFMRKWSPVNQVASLPSCKEDSFPTVARDKGCGMAGVTATASRVGLEEVTILDFCTGQV